MVFVHMHVAGASADEGFIGFDLSAKFFSIDFACIAKRTRWSMNQAAFWLTPRSRDSSYELIPFLQPHSIQIAGSHLSRPMGESSMIVPDLAENCFLQALHFQSWRVLMNEFSFDSQRGQVGLPSGQRKRARYSSALSLSEK